MEHDIEDLPEEINMDDLNDLKSDRPPRMFAYAEETEQIFQFIRERGDQRIGQYLINAIRFQTSAEEKSEIEQRLWGLDADDLLQVLRDYESEDENQEDEEDEVCVACGDGVDSADELQELLDEKSE